MSLSIEEVLINAHNGLPEMENKNTGEVYQVLDWDGSDFVNCENDSGDSVSVRLTDLQFPTGMSRITQSEISRRDESQYYNCNNY